MDAVSAKIPDWAEGLLTTVGFSFELCYRLGNPLEGAGMLYLPAKKSFLKKNKKQQNKKKQTNKKTPPTIRKPAISVNGTAKYSTFKRLLKAKSGKAEPEPVMH